VSDDLFWTAMAAGAAAAFGIGVSYTVAEIAGQGWRIGVFTGGLLFLAGFILFAIAAISPSLPPPNTVKAPVAPPGGAFRAPPGGKYREPSAPAAPRAAAAAEPLAFVAPAVARAPEPAPAPVAAPVAAGPSRPASLAAPRDGGADDLKKIKGVGPKLEELLHSLGYYHFDQIAAWGPGEVAWVDENLEGFKGRVSRDDWVPQARLLAAGRETEFSKRVEDGEVY
jgi:predicted flap endonuclease-1-like 5' DNA nuclease